MKRLWFLGIGLFLVALIAQFPAAWLAPWIGQASAQRWRLGAIEGTVWNGRAAFSAYDRKSGRWHPALAFRWHVAWSELIRGRAALQVDLDQGGGAKLSATLQGWVIDQMDLAFPIAYATVLLPGTLGEYGWSGIAQTKGSGFGCQWSRPACVGSVDLQWTNASSDQFSGPALGDFRVRMMAEGEALRFELGTLRGRLQIAGAGELNAEMLRFTGEAEAKGEGAAGLEAVLRAVGRPGAAPGRYLIEFREKVK